MRRWPSTTRARFLFPFLFLLICAGALAAQPTAARLRGQVTDPSGAVIPGATISLKNASGLTIPAKSDGAGSFDVRNLAPGKYSVSVSAKGFRTLTSVIEIVAG